MRCDATLFIPLRSTTPYLLVCVSQTKFINLCDFTIAFPLTVCCLITLTQECIQRHLPLSSVRLPLKPRLTFGKYGGSSRTYVSRYLERRTGDSQTLWWMVTYVRYHFPPPTESKQSKCVFFPLADVRRLHVVCIRLDATKALQMHAKICFMFCAGWRIGLSSSSASLNSHNILRSELSSPPSCDSSS